MSNVAFESTVFRAIGKQGLLKPDANGYYQVVLGGFNIHNSSGAWYPFTEDVKKLFLSSSDFMTEITSGQLYGEWGHPKQSIGMSDRDYLLKLLTIHEEQVSHHIKRIELDENFKSPEGGECVAVIGWVKPFGPHAHIVQEGLSNSDINFAFSLRSISLDKRDDSGKLIKIVAKIKTYDAVALQGISIADKANSPSLENRKVIFTESDIVGALERVTVKGSGLESHVPVLDSLLNITQRTGQPLNLQHYSHDSLGIPVKHTSKILGWK